MKKKIAISPKIETLFGTRDENLHLLEDGLNLAIDLRSDSVELDGAARDVARAEQVFADYDHLQRSGFTFNNGDLNSMLRVLMADPQGHSARISEAGRQRSFGQRTVQPKSAKPAAATWRPLRAMTWSSGLDRPERARPIWPWPWPFPLCWPSA